MGKTIFHTQFGAAKKHAVSSLFVVTLAMLIAAALFSWMFQAYVLEKAEENITNLLLSHKGIHHYVQNTLIPSYTRYQNEGKIPQTFYAPELLSSSFIVRNQHVFYNQERKAAGFPELYYKLAANNPRNPVNKADALEHKLIRMFNEHREVKSYREIIEIDGQKVLYVAIPFLENKAHCLRCHGEREAAPPELQQRYPGEGGFNERIGEIRAITSIRAPLEHEYTSIYVSGFSIFAGCIAFGGLFFFNTRLRTLVQRKTISLEEEIEERKNAEEILNKNRVMLKQILNTTPQSIFWKDLNGVYLGCNRVFAQAAGLADAELIVGKTDFDLPWPREEAEAYRADDRDVTQSNRPKLHILEPMQPADGSRRWIDTSKVPLLDPEGKVYGVLGVYEDITERKRAEEKEAKLESQLRQAQKMEAIGTLAGGIAHDFNNILSIIFGYTDLALAEKEPQKLRQHLMEIRKGSERARDLVQQILTISRKSDHRKTPLQIALLIKEALKMLRSSIPTTIEIRQDINSSARVLADATQIHQVIMNLCTNAYHAMRETGGILAVSLNEVELEADEYGHAGLQPGRYLKLEVSDTGTGIASGILDKIFEPYFTTKKQGEGTGMGLAVVHGIVKGHHGHVAVYSEEGKGTSFHVYLPTTEEKEVTAPTEAEPETLQGNGERIMFVDDERLIREIADKVLAGHGYQAATFANGVEALGAFAKEPAQYDLVITDMTMPYLTGAELAQKLLAIRPEIPILLCTGQSELVNRKKAMAMGICDYLEKPVLIKSLLTAVRKALKKNNH